MVVVSGGTLPDDDGVDKYENIVCAIRRNGAVNICAAAIYKTFFQIYVTRDVGFCLFKCVYGNTLFVPY